MVLSQKGRCGPCLTLLRKICINSVLESNHYHVLGLNPSATHAEIKSAYYELSKKHHPDKNQGSEKSAKLFRDITEAYKILGNEKTRRQYDREQLFIRKPEFNTFYRSSRSDYNDELERIYYERRRRSYGKNAHYDFEAWYRAHYGSKNIHVTFRHSPLGLKKNRYNIEYKDMPGSEIIKFILSRHMISVTSCAITIVLIGSLLLHSCGK